MAFNVRLFGYKGIAQVHAEFIRQYNADSVFVREEPYLWSEVIATNGATPVASTPQSPDNANVVWVEVPDGQSIRIEINYPGRNVAAGTQSPIFSGRDAFMWYAGATISVVEASFFA